MKLTLTNIKKMKTNSTPLQKRVINYIVDEWSNYDDKKHIFTDVLYHGCQSGVVGFLIRTLTHKVFKPDLPTFAIPERPGFALCTLQY